MTKPRERRPRPEPMTPEEKAELAAKFRELHARLEAYFASRGLDAGTEAHPPPGTCT